MSVTTIFIADACIGRATSATVGTSAATTAIARRMKFCGNVLCCIESPLECTRNGDKPMVAERPQRDPRSFAYFV